jgi:hypothetical protein
MEGNKLEEDNYKKGDLKSTNQERRAQVLIRL